MSRVKALTFDARVLKVLDPEIEEKLKKIRIRLWQRREGSMKQNLRPAHIFSNFAPNRGGPGKRDHILWKEIEADVTLGGIPLVANPEESGDSLCLYVMLVEKTHEVGEPKVMKIDGVEYIWKPKALMELVPEDFTIEKAIRWGLIDRYDTAEDRTLNSGVHCYKSWRSEGWRIAEGGYFLISIPRHSMKVGKFVIENLLGASQLV